MRIAFFVMLLAGGIFYSYIAFVDLDFMTRTGRLGPGFFPRLIGATAIVMTLWALVDELRARNATDGALRQWADVAVLVALSLGYAVLLRLFGGFAATIVFLAVTLSVLNRGQYLKNGLIAVLVPVLLYLLLDRLLNANMPPALVTLPL